VFVLDVYLVDSDTPFVFERTTSRARDELVSRFFLTYPPAPVISAMRTDEDGAAGNHEISIIRAYVGRWSFRESP